MACKNKDCVCNDNIENKMNCSKTIWSGMKSFLGWNTGGAPEHIIDEGKVIQDSARMSNVIQKYEEF